VLVIGVNDVTNPAVRTARAPRSTAFRSSTPSIVDAMEELKALQPVP
jgi:uncharacterized protein YqcC (DUF446 family)